MIKTEFSVAILGATGAVGEALIEILEEREFPVSELYLLASERSAGKRIQFRGKHLKVQKVEEFDPDLIAVSIFSQEFHLLLLLQLQHYHNLDIPSFVIP